MSYWLLVQSNSGIWTVNVHFSIVYQQFWLTFALSNSKGKRFGIMVANNKVYWFFFWGGGRGGSVLVYTHFSQLSDFQI